MLDGNRFLLLLLPFQILLLLQHLEPQPQNRFPTDERLSNIPVIDIFYVYEPIVELHSSFVEDPLNRQILVLKQLPLAVLFLFLKNLLRALVLRLLILRELSELLKNDRGAFSRVDGVSPEYPKNFVRLLGLDVWGVVWDLEESGD